MANMGLARPIGYHRRMRLFLKRVFRVVLVALALLTLVACALHLSNSGDDPVPAPAAGSLRVATYNVHYIVMRAETGPWSVGDWERRKGPLDDAFKAVDADVIGFQEMESFGGGHGSSVNLALDYLLEQNPGYEAAAVGEPSVFPSTQPILYRAARLDLLDQGWFFFSETPDVIYSRTFNGSFPAFASWARFREKGGAEFLVMNVHFEYSSRSNRLLSAELVVERLQPFLDEGLPVILLGDLNARRGSRTQEILGRAGLEFAPVDGATYHFDRGINLFGAIDHVGATPPLAFAGPPAVLRRPFRDEWPTDHYPVLVDVTLPR